MIRLRDAAGRVIPLPAEAATIEICSTDGKIGKLLVLGEEGSVTLLDADDQEFHKFCKIVKAESSDLVELE